MQALETLYNLERPGYFNPHFYHNQKKKKNQGLDIPSELRDSFPNQGIRLVLHHFETYYHALSRVSGMAHVATGVEYIPPDRVNPSVSILLVPRNDTTKEMRFVERVVLNPLDLEGRMSNIDLRSRHLSGEAVKSLVEPHLLEILKDYLSRTSD